MNVPYLQHVYGDFHTPRSGVNHPSLAPYGAYMCGDGRQIIFSVQNQREWQQFCALVMGTSQLAEDTRFADNMDRLRHRAQLDAIVAARFATLSLNEAAALLEKSGIAYGRLNSIEGLAGHEHLRTLTVESEAGEVHVIASGAQFDGAALAHQRVPRKGEHSEAVKSEFGSRS